MKKIILKTIAPFEIPGNRICRLGRLWRRSLLFIPVMVVCFGLAPVAQAVGPDTDGSIPGSNNGEGIGVLVSRTTGIWNTGTGFEALNHLTSGNQNTATGLRALFSDINGGFNTATGVYSLSSNTSGFFNSAAGAYALANNISGNGNTATGYVALYNNRDDGNTATGYAALYSNRFGQLNTANGTFALFSNRSGDRNTATGSGALFNNTDGIGNVANGYQALFSNTTGVGNTATGLFALFNNIRGLNNTAVGRGALGSSFGDNNIALGVAAGSNVHTASNVIAIGSDGGDVSNSCFIGNIFGQTATNGTAVFITGSGKLGTVTSSKRFKEEIKPMDKASEALFSLKPVAFRYNKEIDPAGTSQFGLVAEEVEKTNPALVVRDKEGKPYTVRYDQVNAMLLNEFLKEHKKVEELQATVAQQQKEMEILTAQLKEQAAQIQKVSAQLEASKPAPQMVLNNP